MSEVYLVPVGAVDDEIDGRHRTDHTKGRYKNVFEEGLPAIDDDLIARVDPDRGPGPFGVDEIYIELPLPARGILTQDTHLIPSSELSGTAGLRHRFRDRCFRTHGKHLRTTDLSRNGNPHQRLEHELRILLEPSQEAAQVGFCGGERDSTHSDGSVQRMSDR